MKNPQNTLLAGVAAVALFAATGIAMAQQNPQNQSGAPSMKTQSSVPEQPGKQRAGAQQHAQTQNSQNKMQQHAQSAGKANRLTASTSAKGKAAASQTAQSKNQNLGATQSGHRQTTAQEQRMRRSHMNTAQRGERQGNLKGLQGNAAIPMQGAGGKVSLTPDQRTTIRNSVINAQGAPRVGHVDFNLRVGALVPRRHIHVVPVPDTLVQIDPQWRGFLYFIVRDEVVIVNPRDMRIVAVLPA
jgi:hypothetical protein